MAGRTNDRELLALARTNKTPALQGNRAQEEQISVGHFKSLQNKQKEWKKKSKGKRFDYLLLYNVKDFVSGLMALKYFCNCGISF